MTSLWNNENLIGVQNAKSGYIGKRFAYARRESRKGIPYIFLYQTLLETGLSNYIPREPSATDAFRRACQNISKGYILDENSGKKYKINMILIDESADPILRNIQLTEIDRHEQSSTEGKLVAQLQFHRENNQFTVLYGYEAGYEFEDCPHFVRKRIEEAKEQYEKEKSLVSDMQIHTIIQKILYNAGNPVNGIPSTWNIPATREELLDKLLAFAERLNQFEEGIFITDTLPVIASDETIAKVKSDAVIFAIQKLSQVLEQAKENISKAKDTEKIKEQARTTVQREAEKVMALIEEYESILGIAMDEVRQAKHITEKQLQEFMDSPEQQEVYRIAKRKIRASSPVSEQESKTEDTPQTRKPVRRIRAMNNNLSAAAI